jgi:hypothetical protein
MRGWIVVLALCAASCSNSGPTYTGVLRVDDRTEYAALETPSMIGGACTGWNTVEIRKRDGGDGLANVVCWKREGDQIAITDASGARKESGPASAWAD